MDNLRFVIGPAPSELTEAELLAKITARQQWVGAQLSAFRERMSAPQPKERKATAPRASKAAALGTVSEMMKELEALGMTVEEFKQHLAKKKAEGG